MITLDLKARFATQAIADHLHRLQVLLTELDTGYDYSQRADFQQTLANHVQRLQCVGVHSAYQQACVLLSNFAADLGIDSLMQNMKPDELVTHCMQQSVAKGISPGAFEHLHRTLAGIPRFDEAWLDFEAEPHGLGVLSSPQSLPALLTLACIPEGPLETGVLSSLNSSAGYFRSSSGFQHKVFGKFTALELIKQVCVQVVPQNNEVISLQPVLARCELGEGSTARMNTVQQIDVVDGRQIQSTFTQRPFNCTPGDVQALQSSWQALELLSEASIHIQQPLIQGDLAFQAGWQQKGAKLEFVAHGDANLKIPANALQWQANLLHEGVLVHLTIQPRQEINFQCLLQGAWARGQLPVDEPFLLHQHKVPLLANCIPVISVGKPVLNTTSETVGELTLSLIGLVKADTQRLALGLTLNHSELCCHWQSVDVLKGWSSGHWHLLAETQIAEWSLLHG